MATYPSDAPPPYSATGAPAGFGGPPPPGPSYDNKFAGGPPLPQGYGAVHPQPLYGHQQGSVTVVTTQPEPQRVVVTQPVVVVTGTTCPYCRAGVLQNEFTCCGICLGIFFFPLGLLCCFLMQERRCSNCRTSYGSAA